MAVNYNRPANESVRNYIDRAGIKDKTKRKNLYEFIEYLAEVGVYDDIIEMYFWGSDYNDQTQNSFLAYKDAANNGTLTGSLVAWDETGIKTDSSCGVEIPFNETVDPSYLVLFKPTATHVGSSDNDMTIWNRRASGGANYALQRWGATGTGGTFSIYENHYDVQGIITGTNLKRKGVGIYPYSYFKDKMVFYGIHLPVADLGGGEVYDGLTQMRHYTGITTTSTNTGGASTTIKGHFKYLFFTSENSGSGYHTFIMFLPQAATNLIDDGTYGNIISKYKETVGADLDFS